MHLKSPSPPWHLFKKREGRAKSLQTAIAQSTARIQASIIERKKNNQVASQGVWENSSPFHSSQCNLKHGIAFPPIKLANLNKNIIFSTDERATLWRKEQGPYAMSHLTAGVKSIKHLICPMETIRVGNEDITRGCSFKQYLQQ